MLVVKEGALFVCSRSDGNIRPTPGGGEGLYFRDTRHLSELRLTVGTAEPVLLSSASGLAYETSIDLTNATLHLDGGSIPRMMLGIRRVRLVDERMHERVEIANHGQMTARVPVAITFAADFADMFEIRGTVTRETSGHALVPAATTSGIRFGYVGTDEVLRETIVELDPYPAVIDVTGPQATARWEVELPPGGALEIHAGVDPCLDGDRAPRRSFAVAEARVASGVKQWFASCTRIEGLHKSFNRVVNSGMRDLRALMTPVRGGEIIAAGIPWYVAPFGRDSLLTCLEMLLVNTEPARHTLLYLAANQADADEAMIDAEPGKILHELRSGELASAGLIPHTPYYGTVDATPLFLMLATAYWRWTGDVDTLRQLKSSLDAALAWIDDYGDADGDGFVEYHRRSPMGLHNQGWKDSRDSVVHADGSMTEGPIALVEVQGYVYLARQGIADVYQALGDGGRAASLRSQADDLKRSFNEVFWMDDEGTFALALDGAKRQVRSVTSNPGHCLYCGIVDSDKAEAVAERLMRPDMFSGWGIRTLSCDSPAYNPMSYHNGSVWPHDNSIVAAGLKRYNFPKHTERIAEALFDAALESRDARLPELLCGFPRRKDVPFVPYPVACSPQAWAAAAPFMLLQAMLGISADVPAGILRIHRPQLPPGLKSLQLEGLRAGGSSASFAFTSEGGTTKVEVLDSPDGLRIVQDP